MQRTLLREYEAMQRENLILSFDGPVSQGVVEELGGLMREKIRAEAAEGRLAHRVFAILVEQMQNIARYSVERVRLEGGPDRKDCLEMARGRVVVGREPDGRYFVACGNCIASVDGERIARRLSEVQSMSREELKDHYKRMRRLGPDPDSKGAGLGFIEMARKATGPMDFSVEPVDPRTSFFSMKVIA
ncbi:MAG: SiaB family protein kinase [Desulfovibrio sp.]|jgi:hypothetical protein|nr:SiaB family protein kinase [Desulfovibrio sp.]